MYYLYIKGQQVGPVQHEQLLSYGLTPDTMVWKEGLPNWVKASTLPELSSLFVVETPVPQKPVYPQQPYQGAPQQPYQPEPQETYQPEPEEVYVQERQQPYNQQHQQAYNPNNQQQQYNPYNRQQPSNPYNQPQYGKPMTNWLTWAIVATVLGVLFLNCISLVLGIIAIVKASNANKAQRMGNMIEAESSNNTAKILTIIALVLEGIALLVWLFFYGTWLSLFGYYL